MPISNEMTQLTSQSIQGSSVAPSHRALPLELQLAEAVEKGRDGASRARRWDEARWWTQKWLGWVLARERGRRL